MRLEIEVYGDDGDTFETLELPAKFEVCDRCRGEGSHVNPSIDGNGITSSEWADWDEDDRETYMSGGYDVSCEECKGQRVVKVVDEEHLSPDARIAFERWTEQQYEIARDRAADARYRRMESGDY